MNKEKLTLVFTSGFSAVLVVVFENINKNDDLAANLQTVYHEIIKPNKYYGLVVHEDDMGSYGIERMRMDFIANMIYIDEGYYVSCEAVHHRILTEEDLQDYKNEKIEVLYISN